MIALISSLKTGNYKWDTLINMWLKLVDFLYRLYYFGILMLHLLKCFYSYMSGFSGTLFFNRGRCLWAAGPKCNTHLYLYWLIPKLVICYVSINPHQVQFHIITVSVLTWSCMVYKFILVLNSVLLTGNHYKGFKQNLIDTPIFLLITLFLVFMQMPLLLFRLFNMCMSVSKCPMVVFLHMICM